MSVTELRLVVTVDDYSAAVAFYRDTLGLAVSAEYLSEEQGRVIILQAGRATLEIGDAAHAEYVDEIEVGRQVAGHVRVAFEVADSTTQTRAALAAGATLIAEPTRTPWNSLNARLGAPGALQLTLFEDLG